MITKVLSPSGQTYQRAADILKSGGLVAFPTETVYGLGANALDRDAVLSVFEAKGRPADNPLIVHIFERDQLLPLCDLPPKASELMDAFWPGPLTLLCVKKPAVPDVVTAGLPTVAVRMPSHPVARELLRVSNLPVAAPSANSSGRPSPTTADHVFRDMNGKIPLIIDGGMCDVGVESTVLDLCHGKPVILRPGGITREMISEVLGCGVDVAGSVLRPLQQNEQALSPGMRYKHYAPAATVTLVEGPADRVVPLLRDLYLEETANGRKCSVLCFTEHVSALSDCNPHDIGPVSDPSVTAHRLFDILRHLDDEGMDVVFSEVMPPEGVGLAVMNRLGRAASFRTIHA